MYVWRIPLVSFAVLVTTAVLVLGLSLVVAARRRTANVFLRAILLSAGIAGVAASPVLVHAMTDVELRRLIRLGVFVHHGAPLFVAPAIAALLLLGLGHWLFPARNASAMNWRLRYWAVVLTFAVLNLANWCSPGWCERFGFPFPYSWWSDSIIIMNGENLTAGTSVLAIAANAAAFFLIVIVMSRTYRGRIEAGSGAPAFRARRFPWLS